MESTTVLSRIHQVRQLLLREHELLCEKGYTLARTYTREKHDADFYAMVIHKQNKAVHLQGIKVLSVPFSDPKKIRRETLSLGNPTRWYFDTYATQIRPLYNSGYACVVYDYTWDSSYPRWCPVALLFMYTNRGVDMYYISLEAPNRIRVREPGCIKWQ